MKENARILASIDTTQTRASIALFCDGALLSVVLAEPGQVASECLAGLFGRALNGRAPGIVGAVAVAIGPGSATGIRIGRAFAYGVADALEADLSEVPLLGALAEDAEDDATVLAGYAGAGKVEYLEKGSSATTAIRLEEFERAVLAWRKRRAVILTPDLAGRLPDVSCTVAGPALAVPVGKFVLGGFR